MLARCSTASLQGLEAQEVTVEVDLAPGLPGLHMVGLADAAVQESRERVRSALRHSGLKVPLTRVIVNLAPADLPKDSGRFDLPIAIGILAASGQLDLTALQAHVFAGELSLSGELRPVRGALAMCLALQAQVAEANTPALRWVLPPVSAEEAALLPTAWV